MAWQKKTNITGPASRWFAGADYPSISMPDPAGRIDGDMYLKTIDPDGGTVWRWDGGTLQWVYTGADITGPQGLPGVVQAVIEGANITVDATDPANPVVSAGPPFPEAPIDGLTYARKNAAWQTIHIEVDTVGNLPLLTRSTGSLPVDTRTTGNLPLARVDIHGGASKATPVGADEIAGADSAAAFAPVRWTVTALQTVFQTAFNLLYQPLAAALTSWAGVTRAAGFDAFTAAPSSANLRTLLTDETGTGAAYFQNGALGTPASGTATNLTGLPYAGLLAAAISTAAEYLSNTASKLASINSLWAAAVPVALTPAATITANFGTFLDSECALNLNAALGAPSNVKNGQKGIMWFTAVTSTRILTLNAAYVLADGVEIGPYSITTAQSLGLCYATRGGAVWITGALRTG